MNESQIDDKNGERKRLEPGRLFSTIPTQPQAIPVRIWKMFLAVSAVLSVVAVSVLSAFNASMQLWIAVIYITDFIHCLGMVSHFLIGYQDNDVPVIKFKWIALRYIKTMFFVDLLSVLPLEVFSLVSDGSSDYYAALLRLNRLLRCYQVWKFLCESVHNGSSH